MWKYILIFMVVTDEERRKEMKKWFFAIAMLLAACLVPMFGVEAATQSSDTMILEWKANKVWVDNGELLVRGTFTNKRNDLMITKLDEFVIQVTFTKPDGSKYQFVGPIKKKPMLRLPAGASKTVTLNFGKFDGTWRDWVSTEVYTFTYNDSSARW